MKEEDNAKFKIVLRYKGKDYTCDGYCWFDEFDGSWRSALEYDGVRNCEHDYASLLPNEIYKSCKNWGCEKKEIEVIDYWFENSAGVKFD